MFNRIFYQRIYHVLQFQSSRNHDILTVLSRAICRKTAFQYEKTVGSTHKDSLQPETPPPFPSHDWIGPIDKKSNLRRIIPAQPPDETVAERVYRQLREETMEWNHQFWSLQNERFIKAKEDFVKGRIAERRADMEDHPEDGEATSVSAAGAKHVLSAEEMAEFYQEFLRDNRTVFREYNRQWYRRNFSLLWPAVRANFHRFRKNKR